MAFVAGPALSASVTVVGLRTDDAAGLLATGTATPRLSWRLRSSEPDIVAQEAEIESGGEHAVVRDRQQLDVEWPFAPLASRERRTWRVRVRTRLGWTPWSEPAALEASLLEPADWVARPVTAPDDAGRAGPAPALLFRREVELTGDDFGSSARLYVTSLGVHDVHLNGTRIGDHLLAPDWTDYRTRLLVDTWDVAALLRPGRNVLSGRVADGWYRGDLGFIRRRNWYGERIALLAQLELAGRVVVGTDASWRCATGAVRTAGLYDGTDTDFEREPDGWARPGFDDGAWTPALVLPLPAGLAARAHPPVRVVDTRTAVELSPGHYDFGQNLTGHVVLRASGPPGSSIVVRHAEHRTADGALLTAPLRTARATDSYRLAGAGPAELRPAFTYHGFRHADVEIPDGVTVGEVRAEVVHSDLEPTGEFACSDERITALHRNVVWSQRGNFLAVPTDCPQRDERLGWTGDLQVFASAACHNYDVRTFLGSWLRDLAACQRADGAVGSIVPDVGSDWPRAYGAAGWGDAAVLVPWALWQAYGDRAVLVRQYPSIRAWLDYCLGRCDPDGAWAGDPQFGDWLDPDAPPGRPDRAKADPDFVATAHLARSAQVAARIAQLVDEPADARRFAAAARRSGAVAWHRFGPDAVGNQTGCALLLRFGLAPAAERQAVARRLVTLLHGNRWRIGTGFLGTPHLLPALSDAGHLDEAYRVLGNDEPPSWLYEVRMGATTVWERWDALRADGTVQGAELEGVDGFAGDMLSFNHYAYGAVDAWLYEVVAGVAPAAPGYREIRFAPRPGGGLTWARARQVTRYGAAEISWAVDGAGLDVELTVPPGTSARFEAPPNHAAAPDEVLGSGRHRLRVPRQKP